LPLKHLTSRWKKTQALENKRKLQKATQNTTWRFQVLTPATRQSKTQVNLAQRRW